MGENWTKGTAIDIGSRNKCDILLHSRVIIVNNNTL
jgi:hypothetical protein